MAFSAYDTAVKRHMDVLNTLKHCAGEVIEAEEERSKLSFLINPTEEEKAAYGLELADIIIYVLTESHIFDIDIEEMIVRKMKINKNRIKIEK